jgi:hypothetical protein
MVVMTVIALLAASAVHNPARFVLSVKAGQP